MLKTQDVAIGNYCSPEFVSEQQRCECTQLIGYLNQKKEYKHDTYHIAVSILDRYLSRLAKSGRPAPELTTLCVVSMLMAAKLEQPISPNFNRMINLLPPNYKERGVKKQALIALESDILVTLEFDLQWASTLLFCERMLKALGFHRERQIVSYVSEFAQFASQCPFALVTRQSVIAAVVVTCALNLSTESELKQQLKKGRVIKTLKTPEKPLDWWQAENTQLLTQVNLNELENSYVQFV